MANNKKNEARIKFTAETKEFNDGIKQANNTLSELRAEAKLNETQMKRTGKTVEALENQHSILTRQLEASQRKTEALSQKVEKAVEIYGENSDEVSRLRVQLTNAKNAEEKLVTAIERCNSELTDQRKAFDNAGNEAETLTDKVQRQSKELDELKRAYVDSVTESGELSDSSKDLARKISDLSTELKQNKTALSEAEQKANNLDNTFDDVGEAAESAGDGFTVLGGIVANLASQAITQAIGKLTEFIGYLGSLPAETAELRQDLATLNTSFETVGMSTETATDTWKELYSVFGEDDRAVETANLIAKMSDNQKDLNDWVTITTGIWGSYQDSLPVEGLAEASMETARTSKVTGVLADALNWSSEASQMFAKYMSDDVVTAEDAFNVALSECTTEQERQALITDTLTKLYGESAETYRQTASAQMEAKEVTAEHMLVESQLASSVEPVTSAFQSLKSMMLESLAPAIERVSASMVDSLEWLKEHPGVVKAVAVAFGILSAGITSIAVAWGIYTIAQWAANSAMAVPIGIALAVVAGIAAIVAIIVLVIEYWDELKQAFIDGWESAKQTFSQMGTWIDVNVIQPVKNLFLNLWSGIQTVWQTITNIVQTALMLIGSIISGAFQLITLPFRFIWENCKNIILTAWNAIKTTVSNALNGIKTTITNIWNGISNFLRPILSTIKTTVSTAWNAVKTVTSNVFNGVKNTAVNIWNGIKNAVSNVVNGVKTTISNVWNGIKTTTSNVFTSVKNKAVSVWEGIKSAITDPINKAKDTVKEVVDKIQGWFDGLDLDLPDIKLPHFKVEGKLSISPPSVPKLSIEWYKEGGIMTKPTIFGMNGNSLMAGGEAGHEAILPIDKLRGYIADVVENSITVLNFEALANAIERIAERPVQLNVNGRKFAEATASDTDSVGGMRSTFKHRGLALE